ncbi:hypothetical protein CROQUDRAFT_664583 [Cronartium quercuum f. sp. fusiforme G11]|uniref:Magnesium transporter n=1 Tax=Cronartium quercuum f. sp. fusiforme G11 TaxID=708437 RepID=A0A9P6T6W9_9BASI|nr:hypothetical protein CROQUDRAFT_664583 [Cronartium quercuum f. sp. fusiforme G11]
MANVNLQHDERSPILNGEGQPQQVFSAPANPSNQSTSHSLPSAAKLKFRSAARAVAAAQRIVSGTGSPSAEVHRPPRYQWASACETEPGVNPHQPQPHLSYLANVPVTVDLVDYAEDRAEFANFKPADRIELTRFQTHLARPRPSWSRVRWINVNGLSWDVIKLLAIQYQLHPLAVEDCVHTSARSKSEYYKHHLFVHAAVHTLVDSDTDAEICRPKSKNQACKKSTQFGHDPDPLENGTIVDPDVDPSNSTDTNIGAHERRQASSTTMDLGSVTSPVMAGKEVFDAEREVVRRLTKDYKVRIHAEKLSIFLLRNGTLITVFSHDGSQTVVPLLDRLRSSDTLLRSTSDASMLLQAVLDIIVDQALDVVEAFRSRLTSLEAAVLVNPKLDTVRHLHVLSGELLLLKRTLTPLSSLVHGIRNHDPSDEKLASRMNTLRSSSACAFDLWDDSQSMMSNQPTPVGFVSPQARVYLSDVLDHIDSLLSSLELFSGWASNLVDFTFNAMSFSTNESMKHLSIVTIIFLPLTFLTGYFGMNFVEFAAIKGSDLFFWKLALPITSLLVLAFTYDRILRSFHVQRTALMLKSGQKG